ncbi:uncharacterized protein CG43867-like [Nilaparvata lugens]|uniref:uncharacterized protein CG43867-like n=1 Tax=Nilaparvata lugens TaxID=108931 RepID=UPI00193E069F|nr:uncharacterized protein CG43867-like [Nilaparvata lugens]
MVQQGNMAAMEDSSVELLISKLSELELRVVQAESRAEEAECKVRIMEQQLGQAGGGVPGEGGDPHNAISTLASQVEEQRQLRLQDAKQVEAKAARIKEWVTNKLRELEAQNQHLREQNHKCNQQLELLRRHMAQLSAERSVANLSTAANQASVANLSASEPRPSSLLRANSTGSTRGLLEVEPVYAEVDRRNGGASAQNGGNGGEPPKSCTGATGSTVLGHRRHLSACAGTMTSPSQQLSEDLQAAVDGLALLPVHIRPKSDCVETDSWHDYAEIYTPSREKNAPNWEVLPPKPPTPPLHRFPSWESRIYQVANEGLATSTLQTDSTNNNHNPPSQGYCDISVPVYATVKGRASQIRSMPFTEDSSDDSSDGEAEHTSNAMNHSGTRATNSSSDNTDTSFESGMSDDYAIPPDAVSCESIEWSMVLRQTESPSRVPRINESLEKSGHLAKLGGKLKTWRRRWFLLSNAKLRYWKSQNDMNRKPQGEISIDEQCRIVRADGAATFEIATGKKTYYLTADSISAMEDWVRVLQNVQRRNATKLLLSKEHNKPTLQGWLTKVRNGHAKKCWCVLLGKMFLYFKTPSDNFNPTLATAGDERTLQRDRDLATFRRIPAVLISSEGEDDTDADADADDNRNIAHQPQSTDLENNNDLDDPDEFDMDELLRFNTNTDIPSVDTVTLDDFLQHVEKNSLGLLTQRAEWGHNLAEFEKRFGPAQTGNEGPQWLRNLYFVYLLELRALAKAAPYLEREQYYTGNAEQDSDTRLAINDLLSVVKSFPDHFNESSMFSGGEQARKLKEEFRMHFRNISQIMDCVGCDKCKLWGKLQIQGLGTALKILFSGKFDKLTDSWLYHLTVVSGAGGLVVGTQYEQLVQKLMESDGDPGCVLWRHPHLLHTKDTISAPLTTLSSESLQAEAIKLFKCCQLFISVAVESAGIDYHVVLAQNALQQCLDQWELQAELLCALVKQTSRHTQSKLGVQQLLLCATQSLFACDAAAAGSPTVGVAPPTTGGGASGGGGGGGGVASSLLDHCKANPPQFAFFQGWQLLALAVSLFVPKNNKLLWYLKLHLQRNSDSKSDCGKYAAYCERALERTIQNGGREVKPSRMEVLSILLKNPYHHSLPHSIPVHLLNGTYQVVGFDGSTTIEEFLSTLNQEIGCRESASSGFMLFSDDPIEKDLEHYIEPAAKLCDVISKWETALREKGSGKFENTRVIQLIYKNRLYWRHAAKMETDRERLLLCYQVNQQVVNGRFPVNRDLALELTALMAQIDFGDYNVEKGRGSGGSSRDLQVLQALDKFYPYRYRDNLAPDTLKELKAGLQEKWISLKGRSPLDCVRIYLTCTRKWPFFGASLFQAKWKQAGSEGSGSVVWMAVGEDSVTLLELGGMQPLARHPYSSVLTFGGCQDDLMLVVSANEGLGSQKLLFSLSKPKILEVTLLIADYMNALGRGGTPLAGTLTRTAQPDILKATPDQHQQLTRSDSKKRTESS